MTPIKQDALIEVMLFQLNAFADTSASVATVHKSVLKEDDGFGESSSKNIYYSFIRWTIKQNGGVDKPWPSNWMDLSVQDLSAALV